MFPRRQDPKCGHNLCCHKLTPITSPFVLLVFPFSCFPLNACSIPGGRKACLFRLVWSLSGCSTVSFICPQNYTVFPSVWSRIHCCLEDTKVAFTSNFRSQRPMRVFTRSSWETTEAKIRALSVWPMQVKCLSWIFARIQRPSVLWYQWMWHGLILSFPQDTKLYWMSCSGLLVSH